MASNNPKSKGPAAKHPGTHATPDPTPTTKALAKLFTNMNDYLASTQEDIHHLVAQQAEALHAELAKERQKIHQLSAQNQELARTSTALRDTAGLHAREVSDRDERIVSLTESLSYTQNQLAMAQEAAKEEKAKASLAEERVQPLTERLEEMSEIGRRLHDGVIRGVERIAWLEEGMQGEEDQETMANLAREMKDRVCLVVYNWRRMEERYRECTKGGTWEE